MEMQFARTALTFFSIFVLMFSHPESMQAQQAPGLNFLLMTAGSRAQAMGDAYTAVASTANGIHYNPAGMGFGLNRELMLFHAKWFQDISLENLTFLYPFTTRWSIGSSVSYLHMPEFTRYEIDPLTGGPLEDGTFSVYDLVITTGMGFRITDHIALGANARFFQEQLEATAARGIAFDVGLLTRLPASGLSLGVAVQHLGVPVTYEAQKEALPLTYRAGLAYQFGNIGVIAFDIAKTVGQEMQFLPGMELSLTNSFYVRGGYQVSNYEGSGMTAGFGLRLMDNHRINYVYVPYGDLGDTHRAELILHLGSAPTASPSYRNPANYGKSAEQARTTLNASPTPKNAAATAPAATAVDRKAAENSPRVRLAAPSGLKMEKSAGDKIKISWDKAEMPDVAYNVYAKPGGGSNWIKITAQPVRETHTVFTQKKSNIDLLFVVTAVRGQEESDFSRPIYLKLP